MKDKYATRRGPLHPHWKGGRRVNNGYITILLPSHPNAGKNGYVSEHVLVMSQFIKRTIAKHEVVHHINGIKDDNRLKNLVLMTRSQHHSHHHKGLQKPNSLKNLNVRHIKDVQRVPHPPCICGRPYYAAKQCKACYSNNWSKRHPDAKRKWRATRRFHGLPVT